MKSILKKLNSKCFLLFLFTFFSITTQAQYSEDEFLNDWITEALNDDDNSRIESDGFGGWNDVDVDDDDLDLVVTEMDNDQYNEWLANGGWEDKADHSKEDMEKKENQTDHHYVESWQFNEKDPTFDEMYGDLFDTHPPYEAPEQEDDQYPDDGIRGGGGNTVTTTAPGTPYVPAHTDKLVKPNIDLKVEKQTGNTCAIESLRNILVKILGKNISLPELYLKAYTISNDPDYIRKGLNDADAVKLINAYTATKDITFSGSTAFKDAIDAGHSIIGIFPSGNIEHQVAIIGYQQNGDLIYMDSLTGSTDTTPSTTFIRSVPGDLLEIINAK